MAGLCRLLMVVMVCMASAAAALQENSEAMRIEIGVVLDQGSLSGKVSNSTMMMGLEDFYTRVGYNYKTRLHLNGRDANCSITGAASAAFDLMKGSNVQALIGPQTSEQVKFLAYMGTEAHRPVISFSTVSSLPSPSQVPCFVRMAQNDSSQVRAIAALVHAFSWREVAIIHDNSDNGIGLIPYLTDAIQEIDAKVHYRIVLTSSKSSINKTLHEINQMGTRVFIVHLSFALGKRFFIHANKRGMMEEDYVWIITSELTNNLCYMSSRILKSMQGVLGVKTFVPESEMLDNFEIRWKRWFRRQHPEIEIRDLDPYALWAYDTIWLLAVAAEKTLFQFDSLDSKNLIHVLLGDLDVSPNGENYLKSILGTKIQGLTGGIQLVDGQLQSTDFQIVNVLGNGGRGIGYWTPKTGLSRSRSSKDMKKNYSANADDLDGIIWPGGSTTVPKGWVCGRKLRIGVPVKPGFAEFMKVEIDSNNNTVAKGFCAEVFEKVMSMDYLHYPVQLEYVEFDNGHAGEPGYYNELIYQVYLKNYDAVVGDTTIIANRSIYVDFTQPYAESGISMIVPIRHDDFTKSLWWFTRPFKWNLWLTVVFILAVKGVLVWLFEREENEHFQGEWYEMLGKTLHFSFSLVVFAQREKLKTNYSRLIAAVWTFLMFIIVTSYQANLTAMLTMDKLRPAITDINSLIKNGDYVGYPSGSFMLEHLKLLGFPEDKLKPYNTVDEYADALSKGSSNNGVSAIVDEIPYIKVFLNKYCNQYTMAGPTYKTGGFGFVFPRGSDMVADVSRAVLFMSESKNMSDIENRWFGAGTCQGSLEVPVTDKRLSFSTFHALVYIAAGAAGLAIVAYIIVNYLCPNQPSNVPEVPTSPSSGDVPEVPAGPSSGDVPEVPAGTSSGDVPEVPGDVPEVRAGPSSGDVPEVPASPSSGDVPEVPAGPSSGDVPEVPAGPSSGDVPEVPAGPSSGDPTPNDGNGDHNNDNNGKDEIGSARAIDEHLGAEATPTSGASSSEQINEERVPVPATGT